MIEISERAKNLIEQFRADGPNRLHVISDFDRTLTYGMDNGIKTPSIISMLRDGNHLSEAYARKAHALFDHYHPIEIDPALSLEQKKGAMHEWWTAHNALLLEEGLSRADLEDIVHNGYVRFRAGAAEWLDLLHKYNIPLIVFSASGCGDAVRMFFQKINRNYPNIYYVVNRFLFNKEGRAIGAQEPLIHTFNKDEAVLAEIPEIFKAVRARHNVLLLGDSLGDAGMSNGFISATILKVGFLNDDDAQQREAYRKVFDIVLEGDGDFAMINKLTKEIIER